MGQSCSSMDGSFDDNKLPIKYLLKVDSTCLQKLLLPPGLVTMLSLQTEVCVVLRDCNGVLFICELAQSADHVYLSNGWEVFLSHGGVIEGDYISFEILSIDETAVTVFTADGSERKTIVDARGDLQQPNPADQYEDEETYIGQSDDYHYVGSNRWLWLGKGVELEDWMVDDLAQDPNEWPFYVAKITKSSVDNSRLIFPREFTRVAIKPFFRRRKETFMLKSKEYEGQKIKLSLMRDGRATLTNGWKLTAETNNLTEGSLIAFSFQLVNDEIDMQSVILSEGE